MEDFEEVTRALKEALRSLPDDMRGTLSKLEALNAYLTEAPRVQTATKEELLKKPPKELVRRIMKLQTRQTRETAMYSQQRSREEELKQTWQRKVESVKSDAERLKTQLKEKDDQLKTKDDLIKSLQVENTQLKEKHDLVKILQEENTKLNARMSLIESLNTRIERLAEKFDCVEEKMDQLNPGHIKEEEEGDTQPMHRDDSVPLAPLSDAIVNARSNSNSDNSDRENSPALDWQRNDGEFVSPRKRVPTQRQLDQVNPSDETYYSSSFLRRNEEFYRVPSSQGSVNDVQVKEEPPSSPFLSHPIESTPKQKSFGQTITPNTTASPKRVYNRSSSLGEPSGKRLTNSSQASVAKRAKTTSSESSESSQWTKDEIIRRIDEGERVDDNFMRKILTVQWHPNNFKVNKSFNENVGYAFKQDLRRHTGNCNAGGHTCKSCQEFYKAAGPLKISGGLSWNASSAKNNLRLHQSELVAKASRHRQRFDKPDTPPGFFNSDFPSTQEQIELRKQEEEYQNKIARPRLLSAVTGGQYLFRDDQINKALESFDWNESEITLNDYR
ncbi:hypothetical protein TRVA0_001S07052 [Trichomonascus vanleenenianus]|uniref:ssDNA endodeoxyribonuclease SAE2 n=1 Tax=Trichomonascus vanleenenianus TaxID=2268995 RepID=UPI003ECA5A28